MTPQPRHIEAANKIASKHFAREQRGECPIGYIHVQEIAAALADAENKAAWDGAHYGLRLSETHPNESEFARLDQYMSDTYGPRPNDAAKEVGNE